MRNRIKTINLIGFSVVFFLMTSCYTTRNVKSKESLDRNVENAIVYLSSLGYNQTGIENNYTNELFVSGYSFSTNYGIKSIISNDFTYSDTYTFSDSKGNTVEFNLSYNLDVVTKDTIVESITYDTIVRNFYDIKGEKKTQTKIDSVHHREYPDAISVMNVNVNSCKTSNPDDFPIICNNSSAVRSIVNVDDDLRIRVIDKKATLASFLTLTISIIAIVLTQL